jgi:exonuclease SbcD
LGHIHQPTVIDDQDSRIVYAGNPQGRDMGESGERGCQLVTVGADGAVEVETVRTSRYLWKEIEIDVSGSVDLGALEEEIRKELAIISEEEEVPVVGRIILTGATRLHRELVAAGGLVALEERLIEDPPASQYPIYPEQIICQTVPVIDRDAILCRDDILGEICRQSDLAISNESGRNRLREETSSHYQYARAYTSKPDDEEFDAIIREAEALLLSQLSEGGGE